MTTLVSHILSQVNKFKNRHEDNPWLVMSDHDVNILALTDAIEQLRIIVDEAILVAGACQYAPQINTARLDELLRDYQEDLELYGPEQKSA